MAARLPKQPEGPPSSGDHWGTYCDLYGLTRIEAKIYAKLREGGVHSALSLIQHATGKQFVTAFAARVHIQHIREKLAEHRIKLLNLPGTGYYLEAAVFA